MASATDPESNRLTGLIDVAASRGIIDDRQREELRALAAELAAAPAGPTRRHDEESPTSASAAPEARRGFNAITVAYSLGALLVLFALAWFLVERWKALGPAGVLGVAGGYAAVFAVVGIALRRRGFDVAGGLAVTLGVAMTPVWTWAVLRLTGELPDPSAWDNALSRYDPYIATRIIVMELATIGTGLVAIRRIRFSVIAAPIAAAFALLLVHLGLALGDPRLAWYLGPYYTCVVATVTLAVAYAIERRQPAAEDYAFWFYLAGIVTLFIGYAQVWPYIGAWRHALPLVAVAFVTASLYLRRRTLLVAGGLVSFAYLAYLAFDVFRRVVALPIALAALGLAVIVSTVWMQRRFPALVARVNRDQRDEGKTLPAGVVSVLGPVLIALTTMAFAGVEAEQRTAEREWRMALYQKRARHMPRPEKRPRPAPAPGAPPRADPTAAPPRR